MGRVMKYRVRYFSNGQLMLVQRRASWNAAERTIKLLGFKFDDNGCVWRKREHLTADIVSYSGVPF